MDDSLGPYLPPGKLPCYQLDPNTVSPTREARVDEAGIPVEETICAFSAHALFVDRAGNVCDVPLSNGRTASKTQAEENYKQLKISEQIASGALPLNYCPHTDAFTWVKPGRLVPPAAGVKPCPPKNGQADGEPDGCVHMKAIIEERRKRTRAAWEAQQKHNASMSLDDARTIAEETAKAFGNTLATAIAERGGAGAARANLRADRGEKDS
jgi:hypothetical protein